MQLTTNCGTGEDYCAKFLQWFSGIFKVFWGLYDNFGVNFRPYEWGLSKTRAREGAISSKRDARDGVKERDESSASHHFYCHS